MRDVPRPEPARGEVRVRIHATAVNRADLLQRLGRYPAPPGAPADIPGLEIAGEVDAVGDAVAEFAVGDRVFGLVGGGAYAEYVVVHARTLARLPTSLGLPDAAAVPEAFVTAWDALIDQAHLTAGETVLVHAAGSGVGTAALQIAKAVGALGLGTARSAEKLARCRELGLEDGILVEDGTFVNEVLARTGHRGADVVLDLVGGPYVQQDLTCLAPKGRIIVAGTLGGAQTELDLHTLMRKRAHVRGTVLRARPLEEKIATAQTLERHLAPLFARGSLRPVVDCVLQLEQAAEAHRLMQSNQTFGKIVLAV
jgi:NADPH2:quinone reductase